MNIRDEDPHLVELAVAITKIKTINGVPFEAGTPSPGEASTPGDYFGAIRALKYLVIRGVLTSERAEGLVMEIKNSQVAVLSRAD